jgi:hypothetical protein
MHTPTKLRWRRSPKATGLMTVGFDNSKREWILEGQIDGRTETVATLVNYSADFRPGNHEQPKDEWVARFFIREPTLQIYTLKARFTQEQISDAKVRVREAFMRKLAEPPKAT